MSGLISRIASFEPFESGPFLKGRELPSCVWDAVHGNIDRERGGEKKRDFVFGQRIDASSENDIYS